MAGTKPGHDEKTIRPIGLGRLSAFWGDRAVTVPFNRQGAGWEAAHTALFLISNETSYVSAHTLFFDGGQPGGMVRG